MVVIVLNDGGRVFASASSKSNPLCASAPLREAISRPVDTLGRNIGLEVADAAGSPATYSVTYAYDTLGRFSGVTAHYPLSTNHFSYSYLPGSSLVSGMTASSGHAWTRSYEPHRNLIASVENTYGSTVISRFDYVNDEIGRRISRADSGIAFANSAFDKYSYNARSEVIGAQRYHGTNPADTSRPFGGRGFGYDYDPIGNRTAATETIGGETLAKSYTANALNQYTAIANPDAVGLRGSATNTATVTVNGEAALSDNIASDTVPWHFALPADNADGPDYTFAEIMAVVNPPGTNTPDIVSTSSGTVFAPPQNETLTYDDDGNLVSDGRWRYTWNGENRLIKAEELVSPTNRLPHVVEYTYDHRGRMIWKTVARSTAPPSKAIRYLWDDYNIVAETVVQDTATNTTYNIWGLDIDGTMQGAGGVGGLLAVVKDSATYLPAYDANGNISEYVSANGAIAAHREYDPFGGTVIATGDTDAFTHWFSTKPWCAVTGLSEYQYRTYSPVLGRWMSRDPIEEQGGLSLYSLVANNPIVFVDLLGNKLTWSQAILSGFKFAGGAVMAGMGFVVGVGASTLTGPLAVAAGAGLVTWGLASMADAVREVEAANNNLGPPEPLVVSWYIGYYEWASGGPLGEVGRGRVQLTYYAIDLTMACFSVHASWRTLASKAIVSQPVAAGLPGTIRGTLIHYKSTIKLRVISTAAETPTVIYDANSIYEDIIEVREVFKDDTLPDYLPDTTMPSPVINRPQPGYVQ